MSQAQLLAKAENEATHKDTQLSNILDLIKGGSKAPQVPSIHIRKVTGLPLSTVTARLRNLEESGLIRKNGKAKDNGIYYSTYGYVEGEEAQAAARRNFAEARMLKAAQTFLKEWHGELGALTVSLIKSDIQKIA